MKPKKIMGRPKNSKNRLGSQKTGPKPNRSKLPKMSAEDMLEYKAKIIDMLTKNPQRTISDCARELGLPPTRVYDWAQDDKEFHQVIRYTEQVVADDIEAEFRVHKNAFYRLVLLKTYRPRFRDNYKQIEVVSPQVEQLLGELKQLGKNEPSKIIEGEYKELPAQSEAGKQTN